MNDSTSRPLPRVLIIEDDPDSAQSWQTLLRLRGYEVRCAYDGADGLAVAAQFDPHFVLLDIGLPLVNGRDVARHLRLNSEGSRRFIVATTGTPQTAADHTAFDAHLLKPIAADQLLALLQNAWSAHFEGTLHCY
ncbi:MAG TPA: response regulator [Rubrivivax sp.]|nr:response regulator [Rubrivivax sp.]